MEDKNAALIYGQLVLAAVIPMNAWFSAMF